MVIKFPSLTWTKKLQDDARQMQVELSTILLNKLMLYTELLLKWNRAYNLTAITDPEKILKLHILDSLTVVPYIRGQYILDVGTGAGFPGIPLALVFPRDKFVLLDSNGKKILFLQQVVRSLGLSNVEICHERVEKFKYTNCFATIITRAVGNIADTIAATRHLCCGNGQWLFMKGQYPKQEIQELNMYFNEHCEGQRDFVSNQNVKDLNHYNFTVTIDTQCLKIPNEEVVRHLVRIAK